MIVEHWVYNDEVFFLQLPYYDSTSIDRFSAKWAKKCISVVSIAIIRSDKIVKACFMELVLNMAGELGDFIVKD